MCYNYLSYSHSSVERTAEERPRQIIKYLSIPQGVYSFLSPVPGEVFVGYLYRGCASAPPGYYRITPCGVSVRIPTGSGNNGDVETSESPVYT